MTPEADDTSLNAIVEEEEEELFQGFKSSDAGDEIIVGKSQSFSHPLRCRAFSPPLEERCLSEPAIPTFDLTRRRKEPDVAQEGTV